MRRMMKNINVINFMYNRRKIIEQECLIIINRNDYMHKVINILKECEMYKMQENGLPSEIRYFWIKDNKIILRINPGPKTLGIDINNFVIPNEIRSDVLKAFGLKDIVWVSFRDADEFLKERSITLIKLDPADLTLPSFFRMLM